MISPTLSRPRILPSLGIVLSIVPVGILCAASVTAMAQPPGDDQRQAPPGDRSVALPRQTREDVLRQIESLEHVVEMFKQIGIKDSYAAALNNLGLQWHFLGEHEKAEQMLREAAQTWKDFRGEDEALGNILLNIGLCLQAKGKYQEAEAAYRESLRLKKTGPQGEQSLNYALSLSTLARLQQEMCQFESAETNLLRAMQIQKDLGGEQQNDYATSLNDLGALYHITGQYAKAEPVLKRCLEIKRHLFGRDHIELAIPKDNLGKLYVSLGDYPRALSLLQEALRLRENLAPGGFDYARGLFNLAAVYLAFKQHERAESAFARAAEIFADFVGKQHDAYITCIEQIAYSQAQRGAFEEAESGYRQALALWGGRDQTHPTYVAIVNNLAMAKLVQGELDDADRLFLDAGKIVARLEGTRSPRYAGNLSNLAALRVRQGRMDEARMLLRRTLDILEETLDLSFAVQSERQQLALLQLSRGGLDMYLSLLDLEACPADECYRHVLSWKGAVFARQRWRREELHAARPEEPQIGALVDEQRAVINQLAALRFGTPPAGNEIAWQDKINELGQRKEDLEGKLAAQSERFRRQQMESPRGPEQLRDSLAPGSVLIDVVQYARSAAGADRLLARDALHLGAFVIRRGQPIAWVPLGPVEPIAKAAEQLRTRLIRRDRSDVDNDSHPGMQLRRLVWDPLSEHLAGAGTVLISPDGPLLRVPFAALPGKDRGTYLIEEVSIAVVPVPRFLMDREGERTPRADVSMLLVGDVDFDAGEPAEAPPAAEPSEAADDERGMRFARLPGTEKEANEVKKLFERTFDPQQICDLRRREATASRVASEAAGRQYLHFATHGFFAPVGVHSVLEVPGTDLHPVYWLAGNETIGWPPGLLSGLALAGANRGKSPLPSIDTGIFTAENVAQLDLSAAELVVLSACETGLGRVAGGEGVFGLQRAFQISGARAVIASQWMVQDEATMLLMARFYENHWVQGMGKLAALREAQLWMLREANAEHGDRLRGLKPLEATQPPPDGRLPPYYWAAFVLSGDGS